MRIKKYWCLLISLVLAVSMLGGCKDKSDSGSEEIELIEPVGVTNDYARVTRRDLSTVKILNGKVVPKTIEVHFPTPQNFKSYGALPGTDVNSGDTLVYASTESIDKQIEALEEKMSDDLENYTEYITEARQRLAEYKFDVDFYGKIVDNFESMTEAEKKNYGGRGYDAEYAAYHSDYTHSVASYERTEQDIKERTDNYELDSDFDKKSLNRLKNKRADVLANTKTSGTVVAINFFYENDYITKDVPVGAVGDFNNLEVKTELIYSGDIKRASRVFAIVNGERYECIYKEKNAEQSDSADYSDTAATQTNSYSTFLLADPEKKVKAGDYAVIVVISHEKNDVLCVPKDAVSSDADGSYVYVFDGEKTNYTPVKIGLTSGMFTEIVSGLNEGDQVVSDFKIEPGKRTAELETGTVSASFSQNGYIYYSKTEWVTNPVEYGVTYIDEMLVKQYERVEKGQVIAKIHVSSDDINIRRKERTLLRANEDLAALVKDNEGNKNKKLIAAQNEYIADLQEIINDMKKDAVCVEIIAPYSGIITDRIRFEEGDILQKDARVVQISSEDDCFVYVEDESGQLSCGNQVEISFEDAAGTKQVVPGDVVTVAPCAISSGLNNSISLIKVSPEDMGLMAASNQGMDGWWMRSHFTVKAQIRAMDNVVLVPKSAVKVDGGVNYVKIIDENNNPDYVSFIPGGSDSSNYWVADGLYEGMKICLE